jgi:sigma-B regulation protein RsbU (phosphoserine phosphatase)
MLSGAKTIYKRLGRAERISLVLLVLYLVARIAPLGKGTQILAGVALAVGVFISAFRVLRRSLDKTFWKLRNRLLITYLFIGIVPIVLILWLVAAGLYVLGGQVAVYLVRSELEHREQTLSGVLQGLLATPETLRAERFRWTGFYFSERLPGVEMLLVQDGRTWRYPEEANIALPPQGWQQASGLVYKGGSMYVWAYYAGTTGQALAMVPLTRQWLAGIVPGLGEINFLTPDELPLPAGGRGVRRTMKSGAAAQYPVETSASPRHLDSITWSSLVRVDLWESPGHKARAAIGGVTRFSTVVRTLFSQQLDMVREFWLPLGIIVAALALVAELASLVIGVLMTRSVTRAVHNLSEGTHKVMEGSFSHRIQVRGGGQLAELAVSFNRMTENLERLVKIEKEKERLQSELEIAREVQNQLYPKSSPSCRHLELAAICHPARLVSGDYYDYLVLDGSRIGLAIGDVAGKGISAALLMATVQATLRTQILAGLEALRETGSNSGEKRFRETLSTARLISQLNRQLYAYTSQEKYATFYFGIYDDVTGAITYTNAGHPPPILLRGNEITRLDTPGMILGAFSTGGYQESRIELLSGDLLVCFTDGITEPENEFGEMFGEERLIELLRINVRGEPEQIISSVINSVQQWSNSPELQDDMTLLVARRI